MSGPNPQAYAKKLLTILAEDLPRLQHIDDYERGEHDDPYMPPNADHEYRMLAERAVSNWCPLFVTTPAQQLFVEGFRPGGDKAAASETDSASTAEWKHWQRSRLDARQTSVYRGALKFGHSFTLTEKSKGKVVTKGLSALKTSAVFEDAANDDTPVAALTVTRWEEGDVKGKAWMWDGRYKYAVTFSGFNGDLKITVGARQLHGAKECPITRFAAYVDLEGRTLGVIEPIIALQDRINQTVFDLLLAQTYSSTKVRTVSGMAPPVQRDPETGEPLLDGHGNAIPVPINHNSRRFLFAEDADTKFGTLDESPLGGFIESIDMSIRHLSAITQTPPHYLLGQIANISADALNAAETALQRKIEEFRHVFGESWERVFRLAAELSGNTASADDFDGEVLWRDMENKAMAQNADALGKLAQNLEIPKRGLWPRVPGVTQNELLEWERLADENPEALLAGALTRATPPNTDTNSFGNRTPADGGATE